MEATQTAAAQLAPGWIQTFTGKAFWPLAPRAEDVCIEDIAHALSMKCRFGGMCRSFYSVAQHSRLVSDNVPPADALWGLLHDAAEAYLPDVCRPIKSELIGFNYAERRLLIVIARKFGLFCDLRCEHIVPPIVRRTDNMLLATEARDLMGNPPERWTGLGGASPLPQKILPVSPGEAEKQFLRRFEELTKAA